MLRATEIDNRGTVEVPFGYVEFSDGTRVGFSPGKEAEIWSSNHGAVTIKHFRLAAEMLVAAGILPVRPIAFRVNRPGQDIVTVHPGEL